MTDGSAHTSASVKSWLERSGFPLELKVAQAFRAAGFDAVSLSTTTMGVDHVEREVDVDASNVYRVDTKSGLIVVSHIVECKLSQAQPWICLVSDNQASPIEWATGRSGDRLGQIYLNHIRGGGKPGTSALFHPPKTVGHHLIQLRSGIPQPAKEVDSAGSSKYTGDQAYKGANQVMSYLKAVVQHLEVSPSRSSSILRVFLPVLVVEGQLFEFGLGSAGEVLCSEVPRSSLSRLIWLGERAMSTIVDVVTVDALPAYAAEAKLASDELGQGFPQIVSHIFKETKTHEKG